jgi:hypothetical protein
VACRPVAKRWLYKQRPLLGNARNIHARYNRRTDLCNPFLSNGSVNTHQINNRKTVFSMLSVTRWYKQESLKQRVSCWLGLSVVHLSEVKWSEVKWSSWLVSERVQLIGQLSVESQLVKIRVGGWCEMATSLGPRYLTAHSSQEFCMGFEHGSRGIAIVNIRY